MARAAGRVCRETGLKQTAHLRACGPQGCGQCIGPFPFASGFLIVLSTPLLKSLTASSSSLHEDTRALRALQPAGLLDQTGKVCQRFKGTMRGGFMGRLGRL